MVRVALYTRVSTDEQAREGHSIAAQRDRLLAFCRSQSWDVAGIYADEGHSGATLDRPQLARLREDVRAGRVNLVLVWKVDRLSRRVSHLAQLIDEFDRHGCAFRSVTEPFDTSHAAGRAFLQMLAVFAEFERELIRERVTQGIHQRIKAGYIHGRPKALGYVIPGDGAVWQVDEREAAIVRWIYDQYLRGVGSMRIAMALKEGVPELPADVLQREFGHLSVASLADRVRWILKNPIYAGYTTLNGTLLPGRHEAIIEPGRWHQVQELFKKRQVYGPRGRTSPYILSGLIYCGACGSPMWGFSQSNKPRGRKQPKRTTRTGRYAYYVCKQGGTMEGRLRTCRNWGIRKERVEAEVLNRIRQLALAPQEVAAALPTKVEPEDEDQRRLRQLRAELAALRRRQQNLITTIERAPDLEDALLDRLRELADEQRRLQQEIDRLEARAQSQRPPVSREELASLLAHVDEVLDHADPDELRELVRLFVRRVIVMPRQGNAPKEIKVELYPLTAE
ncbi:recombinase family protein [Thermaerobacter composti]|uniref:Recombinase family protein n=1 Tax=Thermaerobacter composti TaxID=554949 RepID=A0ABZ0QS05_9FIRM|nr:recombinase family protein [Thermaerobacter composti]WPD20279.1 recombinase family protein [Thermaerobacter composti]